MVMGTMVGAVVKNPPANARDVDLIPGLERSPGEGSDNPLQYSCLGNPMDRGAWWATVHKSWTRLSDKHTCGSGHHGGPMMTTSRPHSQGDSHLDADTDAAPRGTNDDYISAPLSRGLPPGRGHGCCPS